MFDLGFLGGGQLARMSIMAAQRMGLQCLSLDMGERTPASAIAPAIIGPLDDPGAIAHLWSQCARLTLENEFIPADAIRNAASLAGRSLQEVIPGVDTLATIQDKLRQRDAYFAAGVPSPRAVAIESDGEAAIAEIGFPMVLKARFGGYDGKGTRYARTQEEFDSYRDLWSRGGWLAEGFVPFVRELAVMVSIQGDRAAAFPTVQTEQRNHVCDLVYPAGADASAVAIQAVRAVAGQGLFGVELFELPDGSVQVNEMAPRPHNTGHYTLDWGGTSQFEQHVRLACGLPMDPAPAGAGDVCMANVLGIEGANDPRNGLRRMLEVDPEAKLHWYDKLQSRPGRKMAHINVVGPRGGDASALRERAIAARDAFESGWRG